MCTPSSATTPAPSCSATEPDTPAPENRCERRSALVYPPPPGWRNPALPPPEGPRGEPATLSQRFSTETIDGIAIIIIYFALGGMNGGGAWAYVIWFLHSAVVQGRTGYTLGRFVTNTRLVDADTLEPIGVVRTFCRGVAFWIVMWLTLGLGPAISMWRDSRGQSMADRAFKAMVIATAG